VKHTRACKSVLGNMRSSPAVGELGANFYFTRYTVEAEWRGVFNRPVDQNIDGRVRPFSHRQVAGAGIPKPSSSIKEYRVGCWNAVVSGPLSGPRVHDYRATLKAHLDDRGLSGLLSDWLILIKEVNRDGDNKRGFLIS